MADHPLTTSPVPGFTGFPGRSASQPQGQAPKRDGQPPAPGAADRVQVAGGTAIVLQLLRERVLARTRELLQLPPTVTGHTFAEILDGEPVPTFVGRLLSAQNQLAACRVARWPPERLRSALADAVQFGADETVDLLAADAPTSNAAIHLVAEVVQHFDRRLAAAGESPDRA
jgi:hypothetical protein